MIFLRIRKRRSNPPSLVKFIAIASAVAIGTALFDAHERPCAGADVSFVGAFERRAPRRQKRYRELPAQSL